MFSDSMAQGQEGAWKRNRSWVVGPRLTLRPTSNQRTKSYGPHQVMGERVPQRYRLYLVKTTHHKLVKPASTCNSVDTLGSGSALPIDVLCLAASHALAPLGNGRTVITARQMRVTIGIFGLGYRSIHRGASPIGLFDVVVAGVTAIDEPLGRPLPIALFDLIEHWGKLAKVAAGVAHINPDDELGIGGGGELYVVGRTKTAVGHLHHPRLRIGAGSPHLGALGVLFLSLVLFLRHRLFLLFPLDLSELDQRLGDTLLAFLAGAQTGRTATPVTGLWVSIEFALKRFDLCLGLLAPGSTPA